MKLKNGTENETAIIVFSQLGAMLYAFITCFPVFGHVSIFYIFRLSYFKLVPDFHCLKNTTDPCKCAEEDINFNFSTIQPSGKYSKFTIELAFVQSFVLNHKKGLFLENWDSLATELKLICDKESHNAMLISLGNVKKLHNELANYIINC